MNYNNQNRSANNFSPKVLLILGLVLTIAIIFGIKLLVVEDAGDSLPQPAVQDSIFKDEKAGSVLPGSMPSRSEATSGDSLAIFEKANEGYSSDGAASTAAARQAPPETVKTTPAPVKKKAAASKKLRQGTVIPRLQGGKTFGSSAQEKQGLPKGADMSEILKQAGQKQQTGN